MAGENDNLSLDNFGIEDTMTMGMGDASLLKDLFAPETQTTDPDTLQKIEKEAKPEPPIKQTNPKVKEIKPSETKLEDESAEPKPGDKDIISSFLGSDDEDEELDEDKDEPVQIPDADDVATDNEEAPNQFAALAKDLFKLGVFTKDEDDDDEPAINTPEEFLERFTAEKKKGAIDMVNNFIGQFGEDYQRAFDAIFVKGVDPKEYFGIYNKIVNFAELDLTKEENQVAVIRQALSDQGFEPEDITSEIDRLKSYGDLEPVATKHHKALVKRQALQLKEKEEQSERELQQKIAIKQQYIQNVQTVLQEKLKTKEFDGLPINPKLAAELNDFLLVDKYKTVSGETLTDFDKAILDLKKPENHPLKVKVALILKMLEKDPMLSTIQKTAVSKRSNQLFEEVARQAGKNKTSPVSRQNNSPWNL